MSPAPEPTPSAPSSAPGSPQAGAPAARPGALFAMGFRPFFLAAAGYAVVSSVLWLLVLLEQLPWSWPLRGTPGQWHAHEMIFGVVMAVVAGFVLTAARSWTGQPTAHGASLAALVGVWLAGRLAALGLAFAPGVALAPVAVLVPILVGVQLAFPVLVTVSLIRPMVVARYGRGVPVLAPLVLISACSALFWLDAVGVMGGGRMWGALQVSVHALVLLCVVIGGRIVPLFTRNRLGDDRVRSAPEIDRLALALSGAVVLLIAAVTAPPAGVSAGSAATVAAGVVCVASGAAQLVRMRTWGTRDALRVPMLAVLHVGYAWIGVGQVLVGLSWLGAGPSMADAVHALTLGALGTLTLGMVARVTLGHTGREIVAPGAVTAAFVLVQLAALVRLVPIVWRGPAAYELSYLAPSLLFGSAWLLWLLHGAGPLTRPRPDGRPG